MLNIFTYLGSLRSNGIGPLYKPLDFSIRRVATYFLLMLQHEIMLFQTDTELVRDSNQFRKSA